MGKFNKVEVHRAELPQSTLKKVPFFATRLGGASDDGVELEVSQIALDLTPHIPECPDAAKVAGVAMRILTQYLIDGLKFKTQWLSHAPKASMEVAIVGLQGVSALLRIFEHLKLPLHGLSSVLRGVWSLDAEGNRKSFQQVVQTIIDLFDRPDPVLLQAIRKAAELPRSYRWNTVRSPCLVTAMLSNKKYGSSNYTSHYWKTSVPLEDVDIVKQLLITFYKVPVGSPGHDAADSWRGVCLRFFADVFDFDGAHESVDCSSCRWCGYNFGECEDCRQPPLSSSPGRRKPTCRSILTAGTCRARTARSS